jgi:hypothetical protein
MEPEGSLPQSQKPATSESVPVHAPISLPQHPSKYYPPIYARFFQMVSFH